MNWYEYLGTSLLLTSISLLPVISISIYAFVKQDIEEKLFFVLVGSLLSYGLVGIFSVAAIPIEFIWNGVINPFFCLSEKPNIICKTGHLIFDYGYMAILSGWAITTIYMVKYLVNNYWAVVSKVKRENKNANQ